MLPYQPIPNEVPSHRHICRPLALTEVTDLIFNASSTVIAGDFDLHRLDWEKMTIEPIASAKAVVEWLQDTSFSLLSVHNNTTFHQRNHIHHSVCDLMVANARAIGRLLVSRWRVNEGAWPGSDRAVIRSTITNKRIATGGLVRGRPNWKKRVTTRP